MLKRKTTQLQNLFRLNINEMGYKKMDIKKCHSDKDN